MRLKSTSRLASVALLLLAGFGPVHAQNARSEKFQLKDIFDLEYASDPQISPNGKKVVYVRNFMDIMKDKRRSNLWIINADGTGHQPLTSGNFNVSSPQWSPDGSRIAFVSTKEGSPQIYCHWLETGQVGKLSKVTENPSNLVWSRDGKQIAFTMLVPNKVEPFVKLPEMPKGAEWAAAPKVITKLHYRLDGEGYLKDGYYHLFVIPADGGATRQLTSGPFHHKGPASWSSDGKSLLVSANRNKEAEYQPKESEIYEVNLDTGKYQSLTDRRGPDTNPVFSPNGKHIAYLGFDDKFQGYQVTRLYVMNRDGSNSQLLSKKLDRDVRDPQWNRDGSGLFFLYDDLGISKIGFVTLTEELETLAQNVGGTVLDRPYSGGSFSVGLKISDEVLAFTQTDASHPADVAVFDRTNGQVKRLTNLNGALFKNKQLGTLEEIWYKSSHDGRKVQGWILKPPGFDPQKKYPLILEIHGGPFANYGPRFAADMQLYAASGYVVFYANPRGSTSYGSEFGNLIHHNYPSQDYDDLMSGVDAVIDKGYIDSKNLFVTGGSGGGVLTAWIIGKTKRFAAAVVGKPVINWYSFVLTADIYAFFTQYWFPGPPWENAEHYLKRSPLSLVGNVTTPTMIVTGEEDHRTPMAESEQLYQALKLRKVETVLVRIPGASHNIAARPSQMIAKTACVLKWFDTHRNEK